MLTAAQYLDEAMEIGREEFIALSNDELEQAENLAERRSWLISQAWSVRQGCDDASYKARLLQIYNMQNRLTLEVTTKRERIRAGLVRSRKESRRLAGYKQAMGFSG